MKKCVMDGCDREVFYKRSGLCAPCYSSLWYWKQKSVTEIVKRKGKLRLFAVRMDVVEPKVTVMKRGRK